MNIRVQTILELLKTFTFFTKHNCDQIILKTPSTVWNFYWFLVQNSIKFEHFPSHRKIQRKIRKKNRKVTKTFLSERIFGYKNVTAKNSRKGLKLGQNNETKLPKTLLSFFFQITKNRTGRDHLFVFLLHSGDDNAKKWYQFFSVEILQPAQLFFRENYQLDILDQCLSQQVSHYRLSATSRSLYFSHQVSERRGKKPSIVIC